jgi:hypothetical protein
MKYRVWIEANVYERTNGGRKLVEENEIIDEVVEAQNEDDARDKVVNDYTSQTTFQIYELDILKYQVTPAKDD